MPHSHSFIRLLLLALVVACGIAVAWFTVAAWAMGLVQAATLVNQAREDLYVGVDGQPVILRVQQTASGVTQEAFSLDRQPVAFDTRDMSYPQYLYSPSYGAAQQGITWNSRLVTANDGGSPAVYWYLVHDGRINGRAYGVGYHSQSGLIVGYFGKQGFSERQPPREEWFQVFSQRGLLQVVQPRGPTASEPATNQYQDDYQLLVLQAEGKIWTIDVARRKLAILADCPDALAVGWLQPPRPAHLLRERTDLRKLLIWQTERLLIVDRDTGKQTVVPLPADLRPTALGVYELPDRRLLLISFAPHKDDDCTLTWLDHQGQVTAQRRVQLARYRGGSPGAGPMVWAGALAAPFPLASGFLAIVYPAERVATGQADSFVGELAELLRQTWPAFLLMLAASGVAAADAYRRQRHYSLPHPAAWAVFVFLLGLPGWLAYRLHRTWPALEPCPACQEAAPIDRPACPDCGAPVPAPRLTGIEVYA